MKKTPSRSFDVPHTHTFATQTLRESEARFRAFVTASSDVLYRMSADWKEMHHLDGRNYMENTDKPSTAWLKNYIHPDDQKNVLAVIKKAIKSKSIFSLEHRVKHSDGSLGWTYSRAVPIFDENNNIIEWFGTATNITERKNKENIVHQIQQQYTDLINTMEEGYCVIEMIFDSREKPIDYRFLEVNKTFEKHTGMKKVVGTLVSEHIPNLEQFWFERYGTVVKTGTPERFINKIKGLDGRWLDIYAYHVGGKESKKVGILFSNVTKQKEAQEALNASELRYRRLFEKAKDGIFILNEDSAVITDANPYICTLLGYQYQELIGKELWQLGFFKDKFESKNAIEDLKKTKFIRYEDLPLKNKEGKQIEVEFVSNVYVEGESTVIQCNVRDITERKKHERELTLSKAVAQFSKERLYTLFMNAPAIIAIVAGPELKFEMANTHFRKLINVTEPIEGLPLRSVVPLMEPELIEIIDAVTTKGERFTSQEMPIFLDWDTTGIPYTKYLDITLEPLLDSDKKPIGLMFFGYDISEQVENRHKFEESAREKEDFLSMASHEMRTPVTSIKGYAQVLEHRFKKAGDTSSALLITKMDGQVDHLTELIGDLFDDTKIKEGKLELRPSYFDFNELVADTIEEVQHASTSYTIESKLNTIPKIYGDKQRLRQVVTNLLTNGIKYSLSSKPLHVATSMDAQYISLSIRDFGVGIQKRHQQKIFTRFFRVRSKDLDTYPGLGLGLYITADIVKRHGGTISVKSSTGKGSTFTVTLPIKNMNI
jgi:PAS domain S-box-containing protein